MYKATLKKSTYIAFSLLGLLPLMKENVSSISIIIVALFVILNIIRAPKINKPPFSIWFLTSFFWFFFIRELVSFNPDIFLLLRNLPFLVFPLIFYYKPSYINRYFLKKTIVIFQIAVVLKVISYLILFFINNDSELFFSVSDQNIPFFRDYVFLHSYIVVHPTYFSAFLLFSFTSSIVTLIQEQSIKTKVFHLLNTLFSLFFILLLSAKIVILLVPITLVVFLFITNNKNKITGSLLLFVFGLLLFLSPLKNSIKKRFYEIKTEINKPIKGDYYNSTNIRVAIIKCSLKLTNKMPFFGYGNKLQKELNNCYKFNHNSNFYKLNTYNTHNFYFYSLLYGGWVFLLLSIFYLFFLLIKNKKNVLAFLLIIQVLIINLTENFLDRHYGIVLFVYFVSLLTISTEKKKE